MRTRRNVSALVFLLCAAIVLVCGATWADSYEAGGGSASGIESIAIGTNTTASGDQSTAVGDNAAANGNGSISTGKNATANGEFSIAIGTGSVVSYDVSKDKDGEDINKGDASVAIGYNAKAYNGGDAGNGAVAIGTDTRTNGVQTVAIGSRAAAIADQSSALGNNTTALGAGSIAFGGDDSLGTQYKDSAGNYFYYGRKGTGLSVTVYDESGHVYDDNYRSTLTYGAASNAIGVHAQALAQGATAIGAGATAGSLVSGSSINIVSGYFVSADIKGSASGENSTSIGSLSAAVGDRSTGIGAFATAVSTDSVAIGADSYAGAMSIASGVAAKATGTDATAIGYRTTSSGDYSVAIGDNSTVKGFESLSVGVGNIVSGNNSGAIGDPSIISGDDSYSVGNDNTIAEGTRNSFVLGNNVNVTASSVDVVGSNVNANVANSVYLGTRSAATAAAGNSTAGTTEYKSSSIGGVTYGDYAGSNATGVVTVGAASDDRRIQNVAAGLVSQKSTDAINGSQLFATDTQVSKNTADVTVNSNDIAVNKTNITKLIASDDLDVKYNSTSKTQVTLGGTGGTKITNVKSGDVTQNSTDAINGSQLYQTNQNVANLSSTVSKGWEADVNGTKVKDVTSDDRTLNFVNGKNINITNDNGAIKIATANDVSFDQVTVGTDTTKQVVINNNGVTVGGNTYITNNGINANSQKITNVKSGDVTQNSTDAVNGGQLYTTNKQVTINSNDIATNTTNITKLIASDDLNVKYNGTDKTKVTLAGDGGTTITNVKAAVLSSDSTDAVNGSQLYQTNQNVTNLSTYVDKGLTFAGNTGSDAISLDKTVSIVGGAKVDGKTYSTTNVTTEESKDAVSGNSTITVKVADNPTYKQITVNEGNDTITITPTSIDMGDHRIINVAAPVNSGDVTNKEYVDNRVTNNNTTYAATMDKHVLSGSYAVSNDNSVALPIVSGDSTTPINYATISNVAKASDLGKIVSIDKTGNGDTTGDTVVSNINNIYHNLKDVSGDVTNNITNINKLIASDDLNVKYDGTDKTKVTLAGNGGTTITNVKAAVLSSDSTEAVNGSQLYQTNQNVTNLKTTVDAGWVANAGGNDLNVTPTNRKLNFKAGSNVTLSSDVDTNTIEISATSSGGTDDNAVLYDGTDKTKVTLKGAGGTTITNVKAAVLSSDSTEAVNGSQLYQTNQNVTDLSSYVNKGLTFAGNTGSDAVSLDKTVSIVGGAKANGKIYSTTNVTTEESKDTNGNSTITVMTADNPNYSQINVTNNSGDTITITPTSIDMSNHKIINVAGPVNSCDVTNKEYVDNSIKNVNETAKKHNTTVAGHNITVTSKDNAEGGIEYTVATASEVSFDKVTVGTDATKQVIISDNGVSIGGKTYVSNSGLNANSQVITNVLAGVASTDAVNVSQLKSTVAGAATIVAAGTNTSVTSTKDKDTGATTYTVDLKPTITVGTGTSNDVTINGTDGTIKTGKVTITGGTTNTVTGLSNTTWDQNATYNSGRAATEEQLQAATKNAVAAAGENDIHIKASTADNPYKAADGTITMDLVTSGDKPTGQQIVIGDVASKKQQDINTTNIANGWTAQIDGTTVKTVNPTSNTLNFEAGENVTLTSDNGSIKIASAGDSSAVHYDKDSAGNVDKTKVTLGDGSTPTTISNLADGTVTQNSTEAVNGSQLYDTNMRIEDLSNGYYQIENQIGDLDTEVARVGANSAALSGLHPLEYDPEYKWDFAAAYGAYRSQHAIAIGAFYRPNENMLLNLATSLGNSNNMYTAGISFRLGAKYDHVSSTGRQAQAKQIAALQEENKAIREDNEAIKAENQEIKAKMDSLLKKLEKMNIKP